MPREIKFRAWDYTQYKMREVEALLSVCDGSWSVSYDDENYTDDIELMQYTGLHDKNSKEIYEGDILKYFNNRIEVVEYEGGGFSPFAIPGWEIVKMPSEVEVIGNIYENPELLEDK